MIRTAPIRARDIGTETLALLLVLDPADESRVTARGLAAFNVLSPAELEVCDLLLRGFGTAEIAERRSTTDGTTRDQIKSAAAKLGCAARLDLVRLALAARPPVTEA